MGNLRAGAGLSSLADTALAAREAVHQALEQCGGLAAGWAVCFFTADHLPQAEVLRKIILDESDCKALCGCSAMGVLGGGREVERAPGIVVLLGTGLSSQSELLDVAGEGLAGFQALSEWEKGNRMILALPDAFGVDHIELQALFAGQLPRVPVFGAGSTDDGSLGVSLQMGMEGVRSTAISVLGLFGDFQWAAGITQSCEPVGEPHFITKSSGNILMELDGRSALQTFIEQGQHLNIDTMQQAAQELLFGFPLDPEIPSFAGETCLVRHLSGFDQETQGLVVPHPLHENTTLGLMHRNPSSAERDMERMVRQTLARLEGQPDFALYFNCAARGGGLYGRPQVDISLIKKYLGDVPLAGMSGGFELGSTGGITHIYTYTGILLLFRGSGA